MAGLASSGRRSRPPPPRPSVPSGSVLRGPGPSSSGDTSPFTFVLPYGMKIGPGCRWNAAEVYSIVWRPATSCIRMCQVPASVTSRYNSAPGGSPPPARGDGLRAMNVNERALPDSASSQATGRRQAGSPARDARRDRTRDAVRGRCGRSASARRSRPASARPPVLASTSPSSAGLTLLARWCGADSQRLSTPWPRGPPGATQGGYRGPLVKRRCRFFSRRARSSGRTTVQKMKAPRRPDQCPPPTWAANGRPRASPIPTPPSGRRR